MSKKPSEVTKAMLAGALDGDEDRDLDVPLVEKTDLSDRDRTNMRLAQVQPAASAPAVSAAPVDMAALMQMLAAAINQGGVAQAQAIKDALGDQASMARAPIKETYNDGGYPGKSVFSHPDGDLVTPRTVLRCPVYMGAYKADGTIVPLREIDAKQCTEVERTLLNAVQPGVYEVTRNDDKTANWRVVETKDDAGEILKLVIAPPESWWAKNEFQQMPPMVQKIKGVVRMDGDGFLTQLTAAAV